MKKRIKKLIIILVVFNILLFSTAVLFASNQDSSSENQLTEKSTDNSKFAKYLAAGLAISLATLGSGIAVGKIGSAAMGAISEKPETAGTALILVALAEGICLWGIAGAFLILFL